MNFHACAHFSLILLVGFLALLERSGTKITLKALIKNHNLKMYKLICIFMHAATKKLHSFLDDFTIDDHEILNVHWLLSLY